MSEQEPKRAEEVGGDRKSSAVYRLLLLPISYPDDDGDDDDPMVPRSVMQQLMHPHQGDYTGGEERLSGRDFLSRRDQRLLRFDD